MRVVCEWGLGGVEAGRAEAAAFVIVDILSFSTAVGIAAERGASVIPFPHGDPVAAAREAARRGAVAASPRRTLAGPPSLSPASLRGLVRGTTLRLPSPNGAQLSLATGSVRTACGSFRNLAAVAEWVRGVTGGGFVAVIAAGERWPDGSLRPAIEDWLGAGALIERLRGAESSEATLARLAFRAAGDRLAALVRDSVSGRELIDRGFAIDVEIALEMNGSGSVPVLADGVYAAR